MYNIHFIYNFNILLYVTKASRDSLVPQMVKNPPAMRETWVQSLGQEDPGEGNGHPPQYSCLENSMDRGA